MALEACCLPFISSMVNRDYIMGHYRVKFDPCDEYLITCAAMLQCIVGILQCFMDVPDDIEDLVDLFTTCILSCALSQQEAEIDFQTGTKNPTCGFLGGSYSTASGAG